MHFVCKDACMFTKVYPSSPVWILVLKPMHYLYTVAGVPYLKHANWCGGTLLWKAPCETVGHVTVWVSTTDLHVGSDQT